MEDIHLLAQFAPQLQIPNGTYNINFYLQFGAKEHFRIHNDDGSIHVAEFEIQGAIFHLHEVTDHIHSFVPTDVGGVTSVIGLFVSDVDQVMRQAIQAGATEVSAARDYDYGYRQGMFKDLFGHYWQIQKKI